MVRAVVATTEATLFAAVAHAAAGGVVPDIATVVVVALLVGSVSLALRLQLLNVPVAAAVAVLAQLAAHHMTTRPGFASAQAHQQHAAGTSDGGSDELMLLAHTLSTVVTVLALVWQEQVLVQAVRWLFPPVVTVAVPHQPDDRCAAPVVIAASVALLAVSPHRGPPSLLLAT